jgi:hypothetical protein
MKNTFMLLVSFICLNISAQETEIRYVEKQLCVVLTYNQIDLKKNIVTVVINGDKISIYNLKDKYLFTTSLSGEFIDQYGKLYALQCKELSNDNYEEIGNATIIFDKNQITLKREDQIVFSATYNFKQK